MIYHFFYYGRMQPISAGDRFVAGIAAAGWGGVDLFFVLSGFLITGILYDARGSDGYFRNFYIRRALRIFPLYYGILVVFFVVLPAVFPHDPRFQNTDDQIWYWTYSSNVQVAVHGWNATSNYISHFWSLAIEEQFYLVWPLLVFGLSRRNLVIACGFIAAGSLGFRLWLNFRDMGTAAYVLTPARMDALAIGAAAALMMRDVASRERLLRSARPLLLLTTTFILALIVWRQGWQKYDPVIETFGTVAMAVAFTLLMILSISQRPGSRVAKMATAAPLRTLGKYSYALYVFHQPVALALPTLGVSAALFPSVAGSALPGQILFMLIAGMVAFATALVSWHLLEKHFIKMKGRFVARPDPSASLWPLPPLPDYEPRDLLSSRKV